MKRILIVGGGRGLASALVTGLLDRGYEVIVVGRTKPPDERTSGFYAMDATTIEWEALYSTVETDRAAPIDGVIFVAGTAVFGKTNLIPAERARQTFELNFWACTAAAKAAAEYWSRAHRGGKFLAILSISGRRAALFESYYSASKAAAARFLECLQLEYAHKNIRFAAAFPGLLNTPFRRRAEWYGLQPASANDGADVHKTARAVIRLLEGRRKTRVIGWRERSIDLADRVVPGLYDGIVLKRRARRLLA
jgi:uncharacterized protein